MRNSILVILCVLTIFSCGKKITEQKTTHIVVAYVPEWEDNWGDNNEKAKHITHINYAFANILNGEVIEGSNKDIEDLKKLNNLKTVNKNLKILISIGGWSWSGNFSDVALNEKSRQKFSNSAITFMLKHQIDGIDLDWEYPGLPGNGNVHRSEDKQNFTKLLKLIRGKLDSVTELNNQDYLLTIATAANQQYLDQTEMNLVQVYVDFINIMTYDFHGGWEKKTGHHANLSNAQVNHGEREISVEIAVDQHLKAGVPIDKLVLGIPFYGRWWQAVNPENNGLNQLSSGESGSFNFSVINDSLLSSGYLSFWDSGANAPYLWNSKDSVFVSYENERSLKEKISYMKEKGMRGIMFWQFNGDNGALLKTIEREL